MKKYFVRKEPPIPFTQTGFDAMLAEKAKLESERPDAVQHLKLAREMGDLSENGYYKASRQRLSFIDGRLRRLERIIKRAKIVASVSDGTVQIGSTVKLSVLGKDVMYTVVGGYESDPSKQSISHRSPLGTALMGKSAGDTVEVQAPKGTIVYTIMSVE